MSAPPWHSNRAFILYLWDVRRLLTSILCAVLPSVGLSAAGDTAPLVKMAAERLPDLNIPRNGCVMELGPGGEPVVFGGHTTGFVPTPTAEYYSDGAWHVLDMLYSHDMPACVQLRNGQVLLAGGSGEPFGIGQNWGVEVYDPAARTFSTMPILDRKRALASAVQLVDGSIVVSGNWYADDAIGLCPPGGVFTTVAEVSEARRQPCILPTGPSDAMVFGRIGNRADTLQARVDRLRDGPLEVPLFEEWKPVFYNEEGFDVQACCIGDYSYLLLGERADGQLGVILVHGEEFSLLPLAADIPVEGLEGGILFSGLFYADRARRVAWVMGGRQHVPRIYLLRIGYGEALDGGEAPVTLFYTDLLEEGIDVCASSAMLPDGSLVVAGGMFLDRDDNYNPRAVAYHFMPEGSTSMLPARKSRLPWLLGLLCGILTAGLAIFAGYWLHRRAVRAPRHDPVAVMPDPAAVMPDPIGHLPADPSLMTRITALMEERQLFLQSGLSLRDVAQALGTNVRYISDSINSSTGASFSDYVNGYRVRHAQALMQDRPGMPLSSVATESGFSSESTFFRNFKALTGKTPLQWLSEFS